MLLCQDSKPLACSQTPPRYRRPLRNERRPHSVCDMSSITATETTTLAEQQIGSLYCLGHNRCQTVIPTADAACSEPHDSVEATLPPAWRRDGQDWSTEGLGSASHLDKMPSLSPERQRSQHYYKAYAPVASTAGATAHCAQRHGGSARTTAFGPVNRPSSTWSGNPGSKKRPLSELQQGTTRSTASALSARKHRMACTKAQLVRTRFGRSPGDPARLSGVPFPADPSRP